MDRNDLNLPDAPDPLESALFMTHDTMATGYELLRQIATGDVTVKEGEDITEETVALITSLENAHRGTLGMLYEQTNALERLRRKLCEFYGIDYDTLADVKIEGTPDDDVAPGEKVDPGFEENFE